MLRRTVARATLLWAAAFAPACVRDDWHPATTTAPDAGDAGGAADVAVDRPTPIDVALVDANDAGIADAGIADAGIADAGIADAGIADVGIADAGIADVGIADAGATDASSTCPAGMVLIPAGRFLMGDPTGLEALSRPVHGVQLSAFCLDVSEVTVAAYGACSAAGCTAPATLTNCNWGVAGREQHPINCVSAEQAEAFCQWRAMATLPTEAQWEYAARGTDGRIFPWGDTPAPGDQLCWSGGGTIRTGTCPTRSFPGGVSALGLYDMGGGVAELTSSWFYGYSGDSSSTVTDPPGATSGSIRMIRGGGWRSTAGNEVRAVYREGIEVAFSNGVGFRCARARP